MKLVAPLHGPKYLQFGPKFPDLSSYPNESLFSFGSGGDLYYKDGSGNAVAVIGGIPVLTYTGDVTGSGSSNVTLTLSASGVTAGTYKSVTVDAKGRVTDGTNPTTLAGYGITDAAALNHTHILENLQDVNVGTKGNTDVLQWTGIAWVNTPASTIIGSKVDSFNTRSGAVTLLSTDVTDALGFTPYNSTNPNGYITGNQTITVTGDVTGSGTTTITLSLPNVVTSGTYKSVTVDAKGRVTAGSNPTTLAGYGITDAQPLDADLTAIAALSGTNGLLKKTGTNTWSLDTNAYITSVTANAPVVSSGGTAPVISMPAATNTVSGYLLSADWVTFNAKAPTDNPIFTGTVTTSTIDSPVSGTLNLGTVNAAALNLGTASTIQTVNIGTGSGITTINIGGAGDTVNIAGTLTTVNTTNTTVTDKLFTLNKGGAAASGDAAGIEIEEGGSITGYAKIGNTRSSWSFLAPGKSGTILLTPGASAFSSEVISTASANRQFTLPDVSGTFAMVSDLTAKEPTITGGTSAQYWNGSKVWTDFNASVREATLTGLVAGSNTPIAATDSVLSAFQNVQAQLNNTTSITGILKGNGTSLSAAIAGLDYSAGTSALGTGILKSTTTTGALSIAVAGDFPILNQNTTGNAATATNATNVGVTDDTTTSTAVYPAWVDDTGSNPIKVSKSKISFVPSTGTLTATAFVGNGAGLTNIPTGSLTNSSLTIGSTNIALGGTATTLAGLTSVTSTAFVGALTGNATTATTATNLTGGVAGSIPYQTAVGATAMLATGSGVLVGGSTPSYSTAPTLTGTNFTGIPNGALTNSSLTIGSTNIALGGTTTSLAGLTSVTATTFTGALNGNASTATTAGTVTTAAQPNITSVGTLTTLNVDFVNIETFTLTTTAVTAGQVIASIPQATFRSAEFQIQAVDATGGKYQTTKILAIHNGSTSADFTEFGSVQVGGVTGVFSVTADGTNLKLLVTPASANSTVFKVSVTAIRV
jgi:hypothetical protein